MTTEADLAAAWEAGYWRGLDHTGPLNDAAIAAKNPFKTEKDRDASPKSVTASEPTPRKKILMQQTIKTPTTVRELGDIAEKLNVTVVDMWKILDDALGETWWQHGLGEVTFTLAPAATEGK